MTQDWSSFTLKIAVKAPIQDIYNAWTKAVEIERWFLQSCIFLHHEHPTDRKQNARAGYQYRWSWFLYEPVEEGNCMQANGKDFFQFTFAGECLVDVLLKEAGAYTLVQLRQHNIPTDEASKFNIRIGCLEGWTFYLANLKSVYENGYDLRNKDPELRGINN